MCLCAGLLLATTHTVSGGSEIRRSDAPRLVDLVREAQQSVDRLSGQRDSLVDAVDNHHGGTPDCRGGPGRRSPRGPTRWPRTRVWRPLHGPGLVVTLDDAQRDAEGRFPGDASPDDLVVHQQDIDAVLNALWSAGAEGIQMQDQRIIATSAPRCVGNTLLLNGRTYSPPYVDHRRSATHPPCRRRWRPRRMVEPLQAVRACASGSATPSSRTADVDVVGYPPAVRMQWAKPAGPLGY